MWTNLLGLEGVGEKAGILVTLAVCIEVVLGPAEVVVERVNLLELVDRSLVVTGFAVVTAEIGRARF